MRAIPIALAIVSSVGVANADDIVEGSVVKVERQEIYVNLGDAQGVADGAALRIKRTVRLRHPVTRAPITDWVPVGSAQITQAGARLSRALIGELIDGIKIGDTVEVLVRRAAPAAPVAPAPTPTPAPQPPPPRREIDPAVADVLAAFTAQSGLSLDARIAGWERYLSTHAESRFAAAVRQDLETLQALREQMRPVPAGAQGEVVATVAHRAPTEADAGRPYPLVFVLDHFERVASAYLHFRPRNKKTYARALLAREHDLYLRGALPADVVKTPGVDYFVEVSLPNGRSGLALGSPDNPVRVEVKPPPLADVLAPEPNRTSVRLTAEALDFATFDRRLGDRRDYMVTANLDVGYRLDTTIRWVGVGYGVVAGLGGSEDMVWDGAVAPRTGFHYGNSDIEVGTAKAVLGGKLIAGVGREGFGIGIEGRVRFGEREGTSLTIRGQTIEQVGWLGDVRLGARPVGDLLVGLTIGATNQPNPDENDPAVKLGTELEWIRFENISVLVRGSWQGRSTAHGGAGGGTSIRFTW